MRRQHAEVLLRVAQTRATRNMGISGLGTNPTNPWCQHPRRSPPEFKTEPQQCGPAMPGCSMRRPKRVGEVLQLAGGGASLLTGLFLLRTTPITAVLIILGAMGWILISAARACEAESPLGERAQVVVRCEDRPTKGGG